ncbi:MAG: polysaccharide deacetylase [Clostridia bacterium]|nr:polysaccharide deacetylase [Clostridia bacterium]
MNNRNFTAICAALLMCAFLIVFYVSPKIAKSTVAFAETNSEKVIYLTFDDGPSDRVTPKILDVLKEEGVKATFFIVGKNAETRKYLIKREIDEGHSVGVHSYSHVYREIYSSPENLINDIDRCNKIIKEVAGKPTTLYRFPGGSYGLSTSLVNAVTNHGMKYYDWNASTRDAEIYKATPEQLFQSAVNTPKYDEDIILLAHDTTNKTATADALKSIIEHFKSLDYVFAAL